MEAKANKGEKSPDRVLEEESGSSDTINSISNMTATSEEKTISADSSKREPLSKDDEIVSSDVKQDLTPVNLSTSVAHHLGNGNTDARGERNTVRPPNIYAPRAHTLYYGGYNNVSGDWNDQLQYVNQELGSPSIYSESPSLLFHTGYGYNHQVPYGSYSPMTTPLPSTREDGQLYSPQQFSITGPYYQQQLPPNLSFLNSPTPASQAGRAGPVGMEQRGTLISDTPNSNDWSKFPNTQMHLMPFYSPAPSPQPISSHGSFIHNGNSFASRPASHQQRPFYGYGSSISELDRGYLHGGLYQDINFREKFANGQSWTMNDKGRRGKGDASLYSFNGAPDFLSEQSRGPRATKPMHSVTEDNLSVDGKNRGTASVDSQLYNQPDFVTVYKDARFFIIKSYSEDNVHKSIKYGVWATTPNGSKKLDAAYHESKEKGGACPVFLLFSVNSSAQFCGVTEMTGPVDFDKSVDYWQQDKWSGQFPVKWHIVKDVPNSLFRHIILENNDKKPVTNSRDTQEVNLEQGLEMLDLFKEHEYEASILDDFDFYEKREKEMQERKAMRRQQQQPTWFVHLPTTSTEQQHQLPSSIYHPNQMAKEFSHVVRLDDTNKEK